MQFLNFSAGVLRGLDRMDHPRGNTPIPGARFSFMENFRLLLPRSGSRAHHFGSESLPE
jgi:hypothetical protein